jgi:hypothetical protein
MTITITTSQLDDLERKARAAIDEDRWHGVVEGAWHEAEHVADALNDFYDGDAPSPSTAAHGEHIAASSPDVVLQLVAIARAALAWSEAHNSDDHDAAAHALRDAVRGAP